MITTIFDHQRANGDTSAAPELFKGGIASFHVTFHSAIGTEVVTLKARPEGSAGDFKTIADVSVGRANSAFNIELEGSHEIYGLLTGADPTGTASPATSKTDCTFELSHE